MPFFGSVEKNFGYAGAGAAQTPVVTGGLVVHLDTGNVASYPGSGSTWSNLTSPTSNATLINTPTYSSSNGGILTFSDTSFQHATMTNLGNLTNWTVEAWVRTSKSLTNRVAGLVCNEFDLVNRLNFSLGNNNAPSNYNLAAGYYNGVWRTTAGFTPTLNSWVQVVGTYNGSVVQQYSNATSVNSLNYVGTPQSGGQVRIMRRWDSVENDSANFYPGDLSIVRIYNRALTSNEVLQNYNANRNRFSLT